jgi:hypothetical protein
MEEAGGNRGLRVQPHSWRGCALLSIAPLIVTVALCAIGNLGIRAGAFSPPPLSQRIGPVELNAVVTLDPACPVTLCGIQRLDPLSQRFYVAWVEVEWPVAQKWRTESYKLIVLPIRR